MCFEWWPQVPLFFNFNFSFFHDLTTFFVLSLYTGYLFSLFWFLDLIFIAATYAEILSLPSQTVFENSAFGGSSMVGRGARLYRLIKIIQQYRSDTEKRKRNKQELGE